MNKVVTQSGIHKMGARLSKYREDIEPYRGREHEFHGKFKPYQMIEMEDNCLLNAGIDKIWDLVSGAASGTAHVYDEADAQIGVGDSTVAANATQTGLQATSNTCVKSMESGYPTSTSQKITLKSSFGTGDANFAWQEWITRQVNSGVALNRKVESLGTKSFGTWTLEVDITLS